MCYHSLPEDVLGAPYVEYQAALDLIHKARPSRVTGVPAGAPAWASKGKQLELLMSLKSSYATCTALITMKKQANPVKLAQVIWNSAS